MPPSEKQFSRGRKDPAMDWIFVFTQIHVKILISNTIIIRDGVFKRQLNHETRATWDTRELACSLLMVSPLFKDRGRRCPSAIQEESSPQNLTRMEHWFELLSLQNHEKYLSIASSTQSMAICYGSPYNGPISTILLVQEFQLSSIERVDGNITHPLPNGTAWEIIQLIFLKTSLWMTLKQNKKDQRIQVSLSCSIIVKTLFQAECLWLTKWFKSYFKAAKFLLKNYE